MKWKKILNRILVRIGFGKKINQDDKTLVCFFPKDSSCAVVKTYNLLQGNEFFENHKFEVHYFDERNTNDYKIDPSYLTSYPKTIIFGHYYPSYPNLLIYKNKFLQSPLIPPLGKNLIYGHVCYGSFLFERNKNPYWISYSDFLKLIFGIPDTNERIIAFFSKILILINESKDHTVAGNQILFEKVTNIYIKELIFLKQNENNFVGFRILYSLLYAKLKTIKHYPITS